MISQRAKDAVALLAVVLIAALVRFDRIGSVEFFHDEAMLSMMAQEMADGLTFPLTGIISSVGIPNPPTSVYVMAAPFAFTSDPVIATAFVAALNVIGVGLLWVIAREFFDYWPALIAGLMLALNPWAILYSRKIWAQDFLIPFLLLALAAALWGFHRDRRWGQIAALPLMLFAVQIHFAAWALLPLFGWVAWTGRKNIKWGAVAASAVLGVLVILPYGVGLAQTLQADPMRISDALSRSGGAREGGLRVFQLAADMARGIGVESWAAPNTFIGEFTEFPLAGFVLPVGIAALIMRHRRWLVGFVLWIALPVVVFQIALADVWPHYFIPQLPAFALLGGIGLAWLPSVARRDDVRYSLIVVAGATIAGLTVQQYADYRDVMDYAYANAIALGEGTSGYTTPANILTQVRDAVPPDVDDVVVMADGMRVWFDVEAARWPVMLRDQTWCVRTLPPDGFAVIPDGPFAVIDTPTASETMREIYTTDDAVTIPAREGEGEYRVSIRDAAPDLPYSAFNVVEGARFANGVTLARYGIDGERVTLAFDLPDAPDRTFYGALNYDYQYFVHILDADGNRIGQVDTSFWPGRHWCAGDRLLAWVNVPTEGAATLRVGFYRLVDAEADVTQAVDVLDAAGNPAGNWLDIDLIP